MSLPESYRLLHQNYFPPAIIAAVRTGLMGQLGFVAMRALGQRLRNQEIVGSPPVASRLGVSSFWIWHGPFRYQPLEVASAPDGGCGCVCISGSLREPTVVLRADNRPLSTVYLSDAKGESSCGVAHWQPSRLRLTPQTGQNPRQSGLQTTFIGRDRIICSVTKSIRGIPSPA